MKINAKIRTLTPIWIGDVDKKCGKIKETGIIGSLRQWYKALIRGLGSYACDLTKSNCEGFNHAVYELFGCTGWSRKLKIRIIQDSTQPEPQIGIIPITSRKHGKTIPKWYFFHLRHEGLVDLEIILLRNYSEEELNGLKNYFENNGKVGSNRIKDTFL